MNEDTMISSLSKLTCVSPFLPNPKFWFRKSHFQLFVDTYPSNRLNTGVQVKNEDVVLNHFKKLFKIDGLVKDI